MTPSEFDIPPKTLGWAREAIHELEVLLREFFETRPYHRADEMDPLTGQRIVKLKLSAPLPDGAARRAAEALQNTRNGFDQICFVAASGGAKPYFPWAQSPTDLRRLLKSRGIPECLWDIFEREQPYPTGDGYSGGRNRLRALATLANQKHTIGLSVQASIDAMMFPTMAGVIQGNQSFRIPKAKWDPEKNEMIIAIVPPTMYVEDDHRVISNVVFSDPGPAMGAPIIPSLGDFLATADRILKDVKKRLS